MVGKAQQQEVDPAGYFPSSQETERSECSRSGQSDFFTVSGTPVCGRAPPIFLGGALSPQMKSLVDLLETCRLGDSRFCEEDNVNHQRGKGIQLLCLEVGWADMEEGQGVRSGAVRSLPLLHSCHSKPPGDGFSYLCRLCKQEGGESSNYNSGLLSSPLC